MTPIQALEPRTLFSAGNLDPYFGINGAVDLISVNSEPGGSDFGVLPSGRIVGVTVDSVRTGNDFDGRMILKFLNSDGSPVAGIGDDPKHPGTFDNDGNAVEARTLGTFTVNTGATRTASALPMFSTQIISGNNRDAENQDYVHNLPGVL